MMGYLVWFNVTEAPDIINSPYNKRVDNQETKVVRGDILAADGSILATTETDEDGNETRSYPFGKVFCHVVGLSSAKSGIEGEENYHLLSEDGNVLKQLASDATGQKAMGNTSVTTLDVDLQEAAYKAIGSNKGAVIVMEPSTGKILAMVSKPDFDPNTIEQDWDALINDDSNSSLFNRALQGQYPPGSTFKILTTLEYIREHPDDYQNFNYTCNGSISKEDVRITCYEGEVHGYENLEQAFVHSCNGAFAQIGMEVNNDSYRKLCESFLFNKDLPIDLPSSQSLFRLSSNASYGEEMMTAIGQGETVVSPFEMALVAATVANGGTMMNPYYIDHIETYDGDIVKQYAPVKYKELMSEEEVDILSGFMKEVVTDGTARKISGEEYTAAGKTGSAEYGSEGGAEGTHSWFVGYLDAENPKLAISVIIEDGGSGSSSAVPAAKMVFDKWWYELQYQQ